MKAARQALEETWEAILRGYSGVYFSRQKSAGLLFLAATFLDPLRGFAGLSCAALGVCLATTAGVDRTLVRSGMFSANALLVGLALSNRFPPSGRLALLLAVAAAMTTLAVSCFHSVFERPFNLPQLSVAFVAVTVVLSAAGGPSPHFSSVFPSAAAGWFDGYLRSLAVVFFRVDRLSGMLVLAGLLCSSRIAAVLSIVGFACGEYVRGLVGGPPPGAFDFSGFNFVMCAVAVGAVYTVPSPSSYVAAAFAAALCAPVVLWSKSLFQPLGMDALSLPFILVTQMTIAALRARSVNARPELVLFPADSPEENLAIAQSRRLRGKKIASAELRLPFIGAWHVSQSVNGEYTHQDRWRYALDFSLPREPREGGERPLLQSFPAFGLPISSAQSGVVIRVVDGITDNEPGQMDTERNWGNFISIRHEDGTFSLLAHLQKGSIRIKPGDRVGAGEVLALCGNSGRSPTPHIHYHLQKTAEPGSETLPFTFSSYIKLNGVPRLVEHALPEKGETVENLVVTRGMRSAFNIAAGSAYRFQVETKNGRHFETLIAAIDLYGWRYLESTRDRSRVYYHATQDMFFMNYCSAKPGSLIFALLLAASKVPLVEVNRLAWKDELPLSTLFRKPWRLGAELISPFIPGYGVEISRRFFDVFAPGTARFVGIESSIAAQFPWSFRQVRARAIFCEEIGPMEVSVSSRTPGLDMTAVRVES